MWYLCELWCFNLQRPESFRCDFRVFHSCDFDEINPGYSSCQKSCGPIFPNHFSVYAAYINHLLPWYIVYSKSAIIHNFIFGTSDNRWREKCWDNAQNCLFCEVNGMSIFPTQKATEQVVMASLRRSITNSCEPQSWGHISTNIENYANYQRKFSWETSELRRFKNAKSPVQ